MKSLSRVRLFATPWTVAHQAPLSMGFSWQEYWCGLPWPPPGYCPNPGIKPTSPAVQVDSLLLRLWGSPILNIYVCVCVRARTCVQVYVCVQSLHSCLTLCDLMDCSPSVSSVHGIFLARILEWVAIPFSMGSFQLRDRTQVSCVSCIEGRAFHTEPPGDISSHS